MAFVLPFFCCVLSCEGEISLISSYFGYLRSCFYKFWKKNVFYSLNYEIYVLRIDKSPVASSQEAGRVSRADIALTGGCRVVYFRFEPTSSCKGSCAVYGLLFRSFSWARSLPFVQIDVFSGNPVREVGGILRIQKIRFILPVLFRMLQVGAF